MDAQLLHAGLVAQNAALGTLAAGVDGQHGQFAALLLQHVDAELVDAGRLACAGYAADADAHGVATVGQTLVDDLLSLLLVVGIDALDQRDGLRENGDVALDDAFHHFCRGQLSATDALALQVGIDNTGLLYATVDLQAGIF